MLFRKINLGLLLIIILSLSPIIPWLFIVHPLSLRFSNTYNTMTSLGEVLGLIGIVMFSLSLVLSTRLEIFEDLFGGMNKMYVFHHLFGGISFLLLLFHPLAMAIRFAPYSIKTAALYLLPGEDWSINFGIAALLIMMSLLILTFFVNIPYQTWRLTHKFMGVAFFIASIHGFYVTGSDISQSLGLKTYILIFITLGIMAYTYRTLLGRFLIKKFMYTVALVKDLGDNVVEVTLTPKDKKMFFTPGQFVFINFKSAGVSDEVHPFSISSTDTDNNLIFTVKAEGDYTKTLPKLAVGDIANIEGSFGRFSYKRATNKKQIWVAGGIGITPFLSMARNITDPSFAIDLYYSVRTQDEAVYLPVFQQISQTNKNFRIFPFFTKTQGRLTAEIMAKTSGEIEIADIFICGPPPMMHSLRFQFKKLGVLDINIHTEEFSMR